MMTPEIKLMNGLELPGIGFGTYKAEEKSFEAVCAALDAGYRLIDTASVYGNEREVGEAVASGGVPREELIITTKAWRTQLGYDNVLRAYEESLKRLKMDYADIYLLHWPARDYEVDRDSWRAMERLYDEGLVKAVGVSNYLTHHLENLLAVCNVAPMLDQIEFHPGYTQWDTVSFAQSQGICVEAWSPFARGRLNEDALLVTLAEKYNVSVQTICLSFACQCGVIPLPKSTDPGRIKQNLELVRLEEKDIEKILAMPQTGWSGHDPDVAPEKDVQVPD
ncbi:MAG: aldo/keto reductase [Mogibacterium sp.]|nr:aldo/keto reductase [Mogibacterium sp.]